MQDMALNGSNLTLFNGHAYHNGAPSGPQHSTALPSPLCTTFWSEPPCHPSQCPRSDILLAMLHALKYARNHGGAYSGPRKDLSHFQSIQIATELDP